ncbi:MAG: trypsin-like peptidase domain-containing protein [Isosphaeraceae bacterium]
MTHQQTPPAAVLARLIPGACFLLALAQGLASAAPAPADDPKQEDAVRNSVVKVTATMRPPDLLRPWTKQSPRDASGTGVVIEGKRVLTNAHVVLYASQLFVESHESSDKIVATVEAVAPGIDLAVLKLEDESFFDKRPPLPRTNSLPAVKDTVLVYGYPQGGSTLSVTKGIVSRIEFAPYQDLTSGLRIQVDAAINPGNSGGPALVDGKVVGLIFSKLTQSDNIGYIIPSEEIGLFLEDVKDGKYDGKPAMFEGLQTLENDVLRPFLKLDRKASGIIVHSPGRDEKDYPLKEWDLITKIGEKDVDNTGLVSLDGGLRLRFQYLVQKLAKDGKVPLTVIRQGKEVKLDLPVSPRRPVLIDSLRGRYPSYFIYGPLAFSPVTAEMLTGLDAGTGGRIYSVLSLIGSPLVTRRADKPTPDDEELVVVSAPMFPHRLSKGYSSPQFKVVKEVNGVRVKNLPHLVSLLRDAKEKFTTISFDDKGSETIVFNHKDALAATDEILNDNGIRQRSSDDLTAVWEGREKPAR